MCLCSVITYMCGEIETEVSSNVYLQFFHLCKLCTHISKGSSGGGWWSVKISAPTDTVLSLGCLLYFSFLWPLNGDFKSGPNTCFSQVLGSWDMAAEINSDSVCLCCKPEVSRETRTSWQLNQSQTRSQSTKGISFQIILVTRAMHGESEEIIFEKWNVFVSLPSGDICYK